MMQDTDWRPSPCLECGVTREAAKDPRCDNEHCVAYGRRNSALLQEYKKAVEPVTTKTFERVECYRDSNGGLHETKESVVKEELRFLLDTEGPGMTSHTIHQLTTDAKIRRAVMKLLGELS